MTGMNISKRPTMTGMNIFRRPTITGMNISRRKINYDWNENIQKKDQL